MGEPTAYESQQEAPPVCPRHPDRVSYVRCQRCGRPVCPECQRLYELGPEGRMREWQERAAQE